MIVIVIVIVIMIVIVVVIVKMLETSLAVVPHWHCECATQERPRRESELLEQPAREDDHCHQQSDDKDVDYHQQSNDCDWLSPSTINHHLAMGWSTTDQRKPGQRSEFC